MQTLPIIINYSIEPFINNLQKYIFGIIKKHPTENVSYWYFTLLTLNCMNHFFKTPKSWIIASIDGFMSSNFYVIYERFI